MIDGSDEKAERFRLMCSGIIRPDRRDVKSFNLPLTGGAFTYEWGGVGPYGHMVTAGSSSVGGDAIEAPVGAYVRLRAYRSEEPEGGGTKSVGADIEFSVGWNYDVPGLVGTIDATTYSGGPAFNPQVVTGMTPIFGDLPTYGVLTHTVTCGDGDVFVDAIGSAGFHTDLGGGCYLAAMTAKPGPEDNNVYYVRAVCVPNPGKEVEDWDGFTMNVFRDAFASYTKDSGGASGSPVLIDKPLLDIEVKAEGGGGTPAEAGHATAEEAKKWYSATGVEHVQLDASAHVGFYFTHWTGDGVAYPESLLGEPMLGSPMPLDNPDEPVTNNTIWIKMGEDGGGEKAAGSGRRGARKIRAKVEKACPEGEDTFIWQDLEEWEVNYMQFVSRIKPFEIIFDTYRATEVTPENYQNNERDECYFTESDYDPWVAVSGTSFEIIPIMDPEDPAVDFSNLYFDNIGWGTEEIAFYRANVPMPCQTTLKQYMYINKPGCDEPFAKNDIVVKIDTSTLFVTRGGADAEWRWPKEPEE